MGIELKDNFKLFLENIFGVMVIDTDRKVVYINRQCADYLKKDRDWCIGKDIHEVFPPSNMHKLLTGDKLYNTGFYFHEGRMSISTQIQLREKGKIVGVLEYDPIQDVAALDNLLNQYTSSMKEEMKFYREQLKNFSQTRYSINNIIGSSDLIKDLKNQIMTAAQSNSTVLITGETGTGKELVAHSIHNLSSRVFGEFVKVNAVGIPLSLAESELFGYEEGAFTGAKYGGKKGKFELASGGTLFIDEINGMPMSLQPKILRALQESEIERVGAEESKTVDVRVIAASNEDLYELVKKGIFREDLYYRLNVFSITVPPLREHPEDIPEMAMDRIQKLNKELGKNIVNIDPKVYRFFYEYNWPGNVRELFNMIERAMNYAQGDTLRLEYFNWRADNSRIDLKGLGDFDNPIEVIKREAERKLINEVLIKFDGNKTQAAKYLKIPRPSLYQKMERLGIKK